MKQRPQNPKEDEHKTWFQLKRVKGRENFSQRRDKTEHVYTVSSVKYRKDDQTKVIVHARNQGRVHRGLRAAQLRKRLNLNANRGGSFSATAARPREHLLLV